MEQVTLLRDRVKDVSLPVNGSRIPAYLGIDIGSVSTNLVVIDTARQSAARNLPPHPGPSY